MEAFFLLIPSYYIDILCSFVIHTFYKKQMGLFSFFTKDKKETLDKGLEKTKENVFKKLILK